MKVDGTVYWTLMTYDADGILVDADSTPTVAVRKNGASVADAVTVTKRSATTGIYDCSHNPAGEAEGDTFIYEESVTISSQAYLNPWSLEVVAAERGTDGANTVAPVDVSSDVAAILADTNELQQNQGNWLTATGFSTFNASTDTVTTDTASRDASKADVSGLATQASVDSIDGDVQNIGSDVTTILADTNELQQNQGDWLTADLSTLNDIAASDVVTAMQAVSGDFKADVSGLLTTAVYNATLPTNFSILSINGSGEITTSTNHTAQDVANLILVNPANKLATDASGNVEANNMRGTDGVVTLDATDVENAVWDSSVSSHSVAGSFGKFLRVLKEGTISVEGAVSDLSATATTFVTDLTNTTSSFYHDKLIVFISGQNNGQTRHIESYDGGSKEITVSDAFSFAPTNGDEFLILATHEFSNDEVAQEVVTQMQVVADDFKADVSNLSQFDPATDVVARVTLVDTTTDLTNQNSGGTNPEDIYTYFTDASREDAFKADLSGVSSLITGVDTKVTNLNDFNPATTPVTTDNASRDASKADISTLATITQINALDVKVTENGVKLDDTIRKNQSYRYTNYGSGTGFDLVTITEA